MLYIIQTYGPILLTSLGQTLLLTFLSLIFASLIGLLVGIMNVGKNKVFRAIGTVYVDLIRSVPLIVLAYFIYFGVPTAIQAMGFSNFRLSALTAGTIALAMNAGAYMAEIFRGGIESVDQGQMEAGRSLGLPYGVTMRKIILPQAIQIMIPSIINQFIISLKDTSILSVIGFPELTKAGNIIAGNTFMPLQVWAIVGAMYAVVILLLSYAAKKMERRIKVSNVR